MKSVDKSAKTGAPDSPGASSPLQSAGSVLLFGHLFFLVVAMSANQAPSALQERLLSVFRPYVRLLNFDVSYTRFHLTHAAVVDAEHRVEYLPAGASPQDNDAWVLMTAGARGSDRLARYQRLGDLLAMLGSGDDGTASALIASAVGTNLTREGNPVEQIRSRRHLLQDPEDLSGVDTSRRDPNDASFFMEVYRAQVLDLGGARLGVQKVEQRSQVAPSVSGRKRGGKQDEKPTDKQEEQPSQDK